MAEQIRFDDGSAYERFMGKWSRLAGESFLGWLAPSRGLRWLDVGCGNGAFTAMLAGGCAPLSLKGIDPSEAQLAYARKLPALASAELLQGDAMALPYADGAFDAAVMPLVIFFVPDPARGVSEMARVVGPGGLVAAYAWDMEGGGFPYEMMREELRRMGIEVSQPPSPEASRLDVMRDLWIGAGLVDVETREITVRRTFADFDDYWETLLAGPSLGPRLAAMSAGDVSALRARLRGRLSADAAGRVACSARANAVKGSVPSLAGSRAPRGGRP
jgi:SAM-dependent methyltransferase